MLLPNGWTPRTGSLWTPATATCIGATTARVQSTTLNEAVKGPKRWYADSKNRAESTSTFATDGFTGPTSKHEKCNARDPMAQTCRMYLLRKTGSRHLTA